MYGLAGNSTACAAMSQHACRPLHIFRAVRFSFPEAQKGAFAWEGVTTTLCLMDRTFGL